jgi:hypothetical protein
MMSARDWAVQADGHRLRVRQRGDGPAVLLVNGIGAHVGMWATLAVEEPIGDHCEIPILELPTCSRRTCGVE